MEFGGLKGLTFDTGQDKLIQDLQYQDQMIQRKQARDAALAQQLIGDIQFLKGSNQYDAGLLKQEGQALVEKLGQMVAEKGKGWESNPKFLAALNYEKQQLPNSQAAIRSVAYQNALNDYQKFAELAQRNPNKFNLDQLAAFKKQVENYGKDEFGNVLPTDKVQPLRFTPPEEIPDFEAIHVRSGNAMDPDQFDVIKNGRDGAYHAHVSEAALRKKAEEIYAQNQSGYDYVYKDVPDKIGTIMNAIRPYTKHEYKNGERNPVADAIAIEKFKAKTREGLGALENGKSLYDVAILNTDHIEPGDEILSQAFTSRPPAVYYNTNGEATRMTDDDFHYNGELSDLGGKKKGIKRATGYYLKPLDWAKSNGFVYDPWGFSGDADGTNLEVKKNLRDRGQIITINTPSGKGVPMFKLNAVAEIDATNPMYKSRVDKGMAAKLRAMAGVETNSTGGSSEFRIGTDEAGNQWKVYPDGRTELVK